MLNNADLIGALMHQNFENTTGTSEVLASPTETRISPRAWRAPKRPEPNAHQSEKTVTSFLSFSSYRKTAAMLTNDWRIFSQAVCDQVVHSGGSRVP